MYEANTPIQVMFRDAVAAVKVLSGFTDPATECPGMAWWAKQSPQTVGAFLPFLVAEVKAGRADPGWAYTLAVGLKAQLSDPMRALLLSISTPEQRVSYAVLTRKSGFLPKEKPFILRAILERARLKALSADKIRLLGEIDPEWRIQVG